MFFCVDRLLDLTQQHQIIQCIPKLDKTKFCLQWIPLPLLLMCQGSLKVSRIEYLSHLLLTSLYKYVHV